MFMHDPTPVPWRPNRNTYKVHLKPEVSVQDIHSIIERILNQTGCRTCGLVGIDLSFFGGDPAAQLLKGVNGVENVVSNVAAATINEKAMG